MESCNYECQRKKNINKLRDLYNKELESYRQSYNKYMEYPLKNIKEIKIIDKEVKVTYDDNTTMSINIEGEIKFIKDYINTNDSPITDH